MNIHGILTSMGLILFVVYVSFWVYRLGIWKSPLTMPYSCQDSILDCKFHIVFIRFLKTKEHIAFIFERREPIWSWRLKPFSFTPDRDEIVNDTTYHIDASIQTLYNDLIEGISTIFKGESIR